MTKIEAERINDSVERDIWITQLQDARIRIMQLEAILREAEYFFQDDFPDGPDGPCAVTERYREAYKMILAAIGKDRHDVSANNDVGTDSNHRDGDRSDDSIGVALIPKEVTASNQQIAYEFCRDSVQKQFELSDERTEEYIKIIAELLDHAVAAAVPHMLLHQEAYSIGYDHGFANGAKDAGEKK